jgi:hypothetical protein
MAQKVPFSCLGFVVVERGGDRGVLVTCSRCNNNNNNNNNTTKESSESVSVLSVP